MSAERHPSPGPSRGKISAALLQLVVMGVVSAVALWKLPQRFPLSSPRFYSNTALPIAVGVAVLIAIVAARRRRHALTGALCAALAVLPAGALAGMFIVFPESAPRLPWWSFAVAAAITSVLLALRGWLRRSLLRAPALGGALLGVLLTVALRAPEPSTRPVNQPLPGGVLLPGGVPLPGDRMLPDDQILFEEVPAAPPSATTLGPHMQLSVRYARLSYSGAFDLVIEPLLTFESRSPDRMWTVLAPPQSHYHPRRLLGASQRGAMLEARYETDGPELLRISRIDSGAWVGNAAPNGSAAAHGSAAASGSAAAHGSDNSVRIEAWSTLPKPVYAHLDAYTDISFVPRGRPTLRFSPCGSAVIGGDSPSCEEGDRVIFGALYADGTFRVKETTTDEKGPFETICEGPLARDEPLTLQLSAEGTERARLTFHDWAAQASTALSPTAGWGVPQNTVTILGSCGQGVAVTVRLSLAATGIGRGWDSVGHAAGVYRNRIDVRIIDAPTGSERQPGG